MTRGRVKRMSSMLGGLNDPHVIREGRPVFGGSETAIAAESATHGSGSGAPGRRLARRRLRNVEHVVHLDLVTNRPPLRLSQSRMPAFGGREPSRE